MVLVAVGTMCDGCGGDDGGGNDDDNNNGDGGVHVDDDV